MGVYLIKSVWFRKIILLREKDGRACEKCYKTSKENEVAQSVVLIRIRRDKRVKQTEKSFYKDTQQDPGGYSKF